MRKLSLVIPLLALSIMACNDSDFNGGSKARGTKETNTNTDPPLGNPPPGTGDGTGGQVGELDGFASLPRVPMVMYFDSSEGSGNYTGNFIYKVKRQGGLADLTLHTFKSGAKGEQVIPDACTCGRANQMDLLITADGKEKNIAGWRKEIIVSAKKPTEAGDWEGYLSSLASKKIPAHAIYLGGFDNAVLDEQNKCGFFACDERKWDNRDDTRIVFACQVDQCAEKEKGFSLKFKDMDP